MLKIGEFSRLAQVSVRMLRHYDELGLLRPVHIEANGYRYYAAYQLESLHRILALRDLGFSLSEVRALLGGIISPKQIRAMLLVKQAELRLHLEEEQSRLQRVESRLALFASDNHLPSSEVILKSVKPQRVAHIRDFVPTFTDGTRLRDELFTHLRLFGIEYTPGVGLAYVYHDPDYRERRIDVEVAYPVNEMIRESERISVGILPGISAAVAIHRGDMRAVGTTYSILGSWIAVNGYRICGPSRTVALGERDAPVSQAVNEVQWPVERAR